MIQLTLIIISELYLIDVFPGESFESQVGTRTLIIAKISIYNTDSCTTGDGTNTNIVFADELLIIKMMVQIGLIVVDSQQIIIFII